MNHHYFEFEVTLLGVEPRLWRRFLLRHTFTFEELHGAIQMACGWQFSHLYEFRDDKGNCIAHAEQVEPMEDDKDVPSAGSVRLKPYFNQVGRRCLYIYDFGDDWQHRVELVRQIVSPERFVQRLTGGEGMFPPEDCGGMPGYEECLNVCRMTPDQIKKLDPYGREDLQQRKEWLGEWRPDGFDLEAVMEEFER